MSHASDRPATDPALTGVAKARSLSDLAELLRQLRRRDARERRNAPFTYRELASKTGWSFAVISDYFAGRVLPPTDRFDDLVRLLGATPVEQGALATARDRVEELRPRGATAKAGPKRAVPRQLPAAVRHFTGRTDELEILTRLATRAAQAGRTVLISAIEGTAGVGKTALAVHLRQPRLRPPPSRPPRRSGGLLPDRDRPVRRDRRPLLPSKRDDPSR